MIKMLWVEDTVLQKYNAGLLWQHFQTNNYDSVFVFGDTLTTKKAVIEIGNVLDTLEILSPCFVLSVDDMLVALQGQTKQSLRKTDLSLYSSGIKVFMYIEDVRCEGGAEHIAWVVGEQNQHTQYRFDNITLDVYDIGVFL